MRIFLFSCILITLTVNATDMAGFVRDSRTLEPLPGAWIRTADRAVEAASKHDGRYLLKNIPDSSMVLTSIIGYMTDTTYVHSASDTLEQDIYLSIGPSFENSIFYQDYHSRLYDAWQNDPDLVTLNIKRVKRVKNMLVVIIECRNNYNESIWIPTCQKYGRGLEIQVTTKDNEKILPTVLSHSSPGDSYFEETEIVKVKPHRRTKLPPMTIPYQVDALNRYHGHISIDFQAVYNFDISTPLFGYWYDMSQPDTPPLSVIEQRHTKLLRLPLISRKKRITL